MQSSLPKLNEYIITCNVASIAFIFIHLLRPHAFYEPRVLYNRIHSIAESRKVASVNL